MASQRRDNGKGSGVARAVKQVDRAAMEAGDRVGALRAVIRRQPITAVTVMLAAGWLLHRLTHPHWS